MKQKQELLAHSIVQQIPLRTRDALYGSRSEAMLQHYKAEENGTIHETLPVHLQVFQVPRRHSDHSYGDAYKDIEACLRMDGLIKFI